MPTVLPVGSSECLLGNIRLVFESALSESAVRYLPDRLAAVILLQWFQIGMAAIAPNLL
jgi:hypothetical protein